MNTCTLFSSTHSSTTSEAADLVPLYHSLDVLKKAEDQVSIAHIYVVEDDPVANCLPSEMFLR